MPDEKYEVRQKDDWIDAIPIPTTHTVVVRDTTTGQEAEARATTVERATEIAIDKIEGKK